MKDYKNLSQMIYKRKSVRSYSKKPVEIFDNNTDLMKYFNIHPLDENIRVNIKILRNNEVKNKRSDYCIAFYSEEKPHYLENIGFIGQQLELELQSIGLGTCWWGMKKPNKNFKNLDGLNCIITMTVGYPLKNEERKYPDGFLRKTVKDILINCEVPQPLDNLIEAARIAPSAVNLQPWLIEKTGSKYNFYIRAPKNLIERMISSMRVMDIGIAMAHMYVQAKADNLNVSFSFEDTTGKQSKFIGSVIVST